MLQREKVRIGVFVVIGRPEPQSSALGTQSPLLLLLGFLTVCWRGLTTAGLDPAARRIQPRPTTRTSDHARLRVMVKGGASPSGWAPARSGSHRTKPLLPSAPLHTDDENHRRIVGHRGVQHGEATGQGSTIAGLGLRSRWSVVATGPGQRPRAVRASLLPIRMGA
jgi:hypothetical protein